MLKAFRLFEVAFKVFIYYGFSMGYVIGNVFIDKLKRLSSILNL